MFKMAFQSSLVFIIFSLSILCIEGQDHMLKFINSGQTGPTLPQFTSSTPMAQLVDVRNRLANAERICVSGMWALYNTTYFGQGSEDTTTVVSIRGTSLEICTSLTQLPIAILRQVKSLRFLGNKDISADGPVIYSHPYLLGATWTYSELAILPTGLDGFPLGSIAITGSKLWLICEQTAACERGVCVDVNNYSNRFLQRNAPQDTNITEGWPRVVRSISAVELPECSRWPSPPPLNLRKSSRRIARMGEKNDVIEVTIDEASG